MKYICDCGQYYNSAAGLEACQINNHGQRNHLLEAAPDLLAFVEKMRSYLICERDCYYEGCSTETGDIPDPEDAETLALMDKDIDQASALIARAKGIVQ